MLRALTEYRLPRAGATSNSIRRGTRTDCLMRPRAASYSPYYWPVEAVLRARKGTRPAKRLTIFLVNQLYELNKVDFYERVREFSLEDLETD